MAEPMTDERPRGEGQITEGASATPVYPIPPKFVHLTPAEELALVREKRLGLLSALTKKKVHTGTVAMLVRGAVDLFTMERLMQERPTSITQHQDRIGMLELAKALLAEKQRRTTVTVLEATAQEGRLSHGDVNAAGPDRSGGVDARHDPDGAIAVSDTMPR